MSSGFIFSIYLVLLVGVLVVKYRIGKDEEFKKKVLSRLGKLGVVFFLPNWLIVIGWFVLYIGSGWLFIKPTTFVVQSSCGCDKVPMVDVGLQQTFDDVESNWNYLECSRVENLGQRVHLFVYYNETMDMYRCEVRYSEPDWLECHMTSGMWGKKSLISLNISKEQYESEEWKTFEFISRENVLNSIGY